MIITKTPPRFASAFREQAYTIAGDGNGFLEVEIVCGEPPIKTLGVKRFAGPWPVDVNVAAYMRRELSPQPVSASECGFHSGYGRSVNGSIYAGTLYGAPSVFTASLRDMDEEELLTEMPLHREMPMDGTDELSFPTAGGSYYAAFKVSGPPNVAFATADYAVPKGVCIFHFDMGSVLSEFERRGGNPDKCRNVEVSIHSQSEKVAGCVYIPKKHPESRMRLCWLNRMGGMDYFTFSVPHTERISMEKKRAISKNGYYITGLSGGKTYELNSGHQPAAVLEALSGIVSSPRIWIVSENGFCPLDVVTDTAVTNSPELTCLELKVRGQTITDFQTF